VVKWGRPVAAVNQDCFAAFRQQIEKIVFLDFQICAKTLVSLLDNSPS
jgi:hypothetical protein